jgi:hypothetical protein
MRKTLLTLTIGFVGLLVVGLVLSLWTGLDAKQPAAADAILSQGSAEPSSNPSPQGRQGIGTDPLTPAEQDQARALALDDPRVVEHTQKVEHAVLLVERHQESKDNDKDNDEVRRADVFIYVYPENLLLHVIANLSSNAVDEVEVTQGVQPLITQEEASHALNIALDDAEAGPLIREQYEQITGKSLVRPSQLLMDAGVYTASDYPVPTARACGVHRCAQLLLSVPNSFPLDVIPIIDLSTQRVVFAGQ